MGCTRRRAGLAILAVVAVAACEAAQPERIVVVGDVHGDFGQFTAVLKSAGVIDARNRWSGGTTHLVQMGDIPDRGPDTKKIIEYLMDLEKQARRAKGMVHFLIGNHEAMNVYGDLRYVIPEEFEAFASRDGEYRAMAWEMYEAEAKAKGVKLSGEDRKKWDAERPKGYFEHRVAFAPGGRFYKWIVAHDALVKLGETLFVHAGISPKYAGEQMEALNARVREELTDFSRLQGGAVMDADGPLWYRGMAAGDEAELAQHVDAVLARHGVSRIVIGHTPMPGAVIPRFGGNVVIVDVGLSKSYGGGMACLLIEKGEASAIHRGKRLALPRGGTAEVLAYLKAAAALDPAPSPLTEMIKKLETAGQ